MRTGALSTFAVVLFASAAHGQTWAPISDDALTKPEILGGKPAVPADWPATVQFRSPGGNCTGTLIGERVVVTAAHCVRHRESAKVLFDNVEYDLECLHHEQYKGESCLTAASAAQIKGCTADISLCRISPDAPASKKSFPLKTETGAVVRFESISLASPGVSVGDQVTLLGYGCTTPGGAISEILQVGTSEVKTLSVPGASSDPDKTLQEYIITKDGAAICQGDSGGAAYVGTGTSRKVFGLNSRGNISTTSFLTATGDPHIAQFLQGWESPICGVHPTAKGC